METINNSNNSGKTYDSTAANGSTSANTTTIMESNHTTNIDAKVQDAAKTNALDEFNKSRTTDNNNNGSNIVKEKSTNIDDNDSLADVNMELENNDNEEDSEELLGIVSNEVKNIILQVISPYFDDEAGIVTSNVRPNSPLENKKNTGSDYHAKNGASNKGITNDEEQIGSNVTASDRNGINYKNNKSDIDGEANYSSSNNNNNNTSNNANHDNNDDSVVGSRDDEREFVQHYDHNKSKEWITLICDGIMEKLIAMSKPYKFIVHTMIMRKNGAGMHVCSSCYYRQTDGWVSHAHDLSTHRYAVVTVYWSAI